MSLWLDSLGEDVIPRRALGESIDVDVAIVGAGYSGLWTAFYLKELRPELRIAILEAEVAGFGASGRNGGWVVGNLNGLEELLQDPEQREAGAALFRAIVGTIDEVGRVCRDENIACDFKKAGALHFATNAGQAERLRRHVSDMTSWGFPEAIRWLTAEEMQQHVRPRSCLGGTYEPHCAVLQPGRLVRGLAEAVERRGVALYERTRVLRMDGGHVETESGRVRADVVVRATEAYTARLRGHGRAMLPLHSWMLATEPLPDAVWKEIGLSNREVFGDGRRMVTYGQRTADGRLAFGGRGTYEYGSGIRNSFDPAHPHYRHMERMLRRMFPVLENVRFTHHWGGALGVPRDWRPVVGLDREAHFAWIGGYVGQGVAASNLAGRTLADLIAGEETERTRLPWVAPPARNWEPEPLRWLGVRSITWAGSRADATEEAGRRSRFADALFGLVTGR